jgi:hypothetical protein
MTHVGLKIIRVFFRLTRYYCDKMPQDRDILLKSAQYMDHHRCRRNASLLSSSHGSNSRWRLLVHMVHSAALFLLFLTIYSLNTRLNVFPSLADYGHVRLHNVTRWEERLFFGYSPTAWFQSSPLVDCNEVGLAIAWQTAMDWLSSVPYLLHYGIPIVYPLGLCLAGKSELAADFYTLIGLSNWLMLPIWYATPTAPPWLAAHGAALSNQEITSTTNDSDISSFSQSPASLDTVRNVGVSAGISMEGCAFSRLDAISGIQFFYRLFHRNPVPFAAFPSGHVAWATCIYVIAPPANRCFLAYIALVVWATLHTCHHYVLDAVGAVLVVLTANQIIFHLRRRGYRHSICMCDNYGVLCSVTCS